MNDYQLIDSGNSEKLERFGPFLLRRPDPQALYAKHLPESEWKKAHAAFEVASGKGKWKVTTGKEIPETWPVKIDSLTFSATLGSFKHVGVFPEQETNWKWLRETIQKRVEGGTKGTKVTILNLFAYTGGATLACLQAGAEVVHVDASQGIVDVAAKNAHLSNLSDKPVRWIVDDVKKFIARELKRGNKYHGIIMDPPAYGHGPKKEVWNIEEHLLPLIDDAKQLLTGDALFMLINGYSAGYSPIAYGNNILSLEKKGGKVETGELTLVEEGSGRLLPAGIFARWRNQ